MGVETILSLLGSVGSLYMILLTLLLVVGLGLMIMGFAKYIARHAKAKTLRNTATFGTVGLFWQDNGWLKLALFSFVGILTAALLLSIMTPEGMYGGNSMTGHGSMQMQGMPTQSGMNMNGMNKNNGTMGNMQMQGGMSGMGPMSMNAPMSGMQVGGTQADLGAMIMQRLSQMQMQINQMQQQMAMNNIGGIGIK